jgi:hypothetical protein
VRWLGLRGYPSALRFKVTDRNYIVVI